MLNFVSNNPILCELSFAPVAVSWVTVGIMILYLIIKWRTNNPFRLSTPGLAILSYLSFLLIPGIFAVPTTGDVEASERFLYLLSAAGIFMLAGMAMCSVIYPSPRISLRDYFRAPVSVNPAVGMPSFFLFLGIFIIISTMVRYYRTGGVTFFYILTHPHQFEAIGAARDALKLTNLGLTSQLFGYAITWSMILFLPLITIYMQSLYNKTRLPKWRYGFWFGVFFCMLLGLWEGSKSGGARVASIFFASSYIIRGGISKKLLIGGALIVFLPFSLAVLIHPAGMQRGLIYTGMLHRAFVAPAQLTYAYCEIFPKVYGYTKGCGTSYMALGRQRVNIPLLVGQYLAKEGSLSTTYANASFVANGWAEFGYAGVIIYAIVAGFLAQFLNNHIFNRAFYGKTPQIIWLQSVQVPLWTVVFASGSITEFFIGQGVILMIILVWMCDRHYSGSQDDLVEDDLIEDDSIEGDSIEGDSDYKY
jgi:hypothetical protein